ncbi:MAG: hypothetical protein KF815_01300 [Rhodospirillales bacterium]|nr:hypothetical protein [Rhodospirillales bacterium]
MFALRTRPNPFPEAEAVDPDQLVKRRAEAFAQLKAIEADRARQITAIEKRIAKAEAILKPIDDARKALAEARADLQAVETSTGHARDAALAAARDAAPAELVEALARLREQQRALMVVDFGVVSPADRRRQTDRAAAVVSLMRDIEAALEAPLTEAQVEDLVNRARAAVYK